MTSSSASSVSEVEDPIGAELDAEISSLKSQISTLKSQRALQARHILSSHTTHAILSRLRASKPAPPSSSSNSTSSGPPDVSPLLQTSSQQLAHNQENLYRACASITTFPIQDPDPNAVDHGKVLGIRIDVSSLGRFARPYYVMLNKPYVGEDVLRVHRHTIPPCIPVAALAARYLPIAKGAGEEGGAKGARKQNLGKFIRALRREIVAYHNRTTVIKSLRREFKLDEDREKRGKGKGKERERIIADISAADAEAKQVRIEWVDGKIGRCVVGESGMVEKCVVISEQGRDWEVERRILGGDKGDASMRGIGERLREGIY